MVVLVLTCQPPRKASISGDMSDMYVPAPSDRQLRDQREDEVVDPIPVGRPVLEIAVVEALMLGQIGLELIAAVLARPLQRVVDVGRIA